MASTKKQTVIDKATKDRPDHKPLDPDKRAVLIIRHAPTNTVIRSWGWTLNEVLAHMDWKRDDIWATFVRPYSRNRGAALLVFPSELNRAIASLNDQ